MVIDHQNVLDYWFPRQGPKAELDRKQRWFSGGDEVDQAITLQFRDAVSLAGQGKLSEWRETPKGCLAEIILLDQFTRNIYRGLAAAYRHDSLALALCRKGISQHIDDALLPIERLFFYMPLQHSESIEDQQESVFHYNRLRHQVSPSESVLVEGFYQYAVQHHDIIARFGRFPHRNVVLRRLSSQAELDWLNSKDGVRFGQ